MASRLYGLKFGRPIFEFGISGSAGSDHGSEEPPFPIWRGTTALVSRYYRWGGTAAGWSQYYRPPNGTTAAGRATGEWG